MAVIDKPHRARRNLLRALFRRGRNAPEWEPTQLPRSMTRADAEAILEEYHTCKEKADPWIKRIEAARALMDDIPSDTYGRYRLRRHKPRRILDQGLARKIIERLGEAVPWTHTKAPVKVDRV